MFWQLHKKWQWNNSNDKWSAHLEIVSYDRSNKVRMMLKFHQFIYPKERLFGGEKKNVSKIIPENTLEKSAHVDGHIAQMSSQI